MRQGRGQWKLPVIRPHEALWRILLLTRSMKPSEKTVAFVSGITAWVGSISSLILHTSIFIAVFVLGAADIAPWDFLLLVLTTIVSLEAIYLAIFIQYTVNRQGESLKEVEEDIDEIQEDIDEIQEDVEDITEDIDEIQEDVEEMTEEEKEELERKNRQKMTLEQLTVDVQRLLVDLEELKKGK